MNELSEEGVVVVQDLLTRGEEVQNLRKTIDDSLARLEARDLYPQMDELQSQIRVARDDEKSALLGDITRLKRELSLIGGGTGRWRLSGETS
jgi:hypothetical protein